MVSVDVLTNDTGLEDAPVVISVTSAPAQGVATVNGDNIDYQPAIGFSGIATFEYTVTDADGDSDNALVTITVLADGVTNHIPIATDDNATTIFNTSVDIDVLTNDTGLEDGFGSIIIHAQPLHGTVQVNLNRTITYTPSYMFIGSDSFVYWLEDIHGDYDLATVSITVTETPDYIPVANPDRRGTEYETLVSVDVLTNDTGLEDTPIVITITSSPAQGTAIVNGDQVEYNPALGFSGIATFEYTVTDADGDSDNALVTITVLE